MSRERRSSKAHLRLCTLSTGRRGACWTGRCPFVDSLSETMHIEFGGSSRAASPPDPASRLHADTSSRNSLKVRFIPIKSHSGTSLLILTPLWSRENVFSIQDQCICERSPCSLQGVQEKDSARGKMRNRFLWRSEVHISGINIAERVHPKLHARLPASITLSMLLRQDAAMQQGANPAASVAPSLQHSTPCRGEIQTRRQDGQLDAPK